MPTPARLSAEPRRASPVLPSMSATRRGGQRRPDDFYESPGWCVQRLYQVAGDVLPPPTLDPCAGRGAIMHEASLLAMPMRGVERCPERARYAGIRALDVETGDGLARSWRGEHVLMNPPFAQAREFVEKAVSEAESTVALLRLAYLGSKKRAPWWGDNPPSGLVVLAPRPSFTGSGTDSADYGWFAWGVEPFGFRWALR